MLSNKLNGYRDRCWGFTREFWGEVTGKQWLFAEGLRQRMIGRLESYNDMSHQQAEEQIDQLKHT